MWFRNKNEYMEMYLKYPHTHLKIAGVWPTLPSKWAYFWKIYSIFFTYFLSFLICLSLVIDFLFSLDSLDNAIDAVYVTVSNVSYFLKFIAFTIKHKKFKNLLKSLDNPIFVANKKQHQMFVIKWMHFANTYTKWFYYSIYVCVLFFAIFPLLDKTEKAVLPFRGWVPFNTQTSRTNYYIAYSFQMFSIFFVAAVNMSLDTMPSIFMNIGCAQLEILKWNLENAINEAENYEENERKILNEKFIKKYAYFPLNERVENELHKILSHCVLHNDAIYKLFVDIEELFNPGMLILFLSNGIAICISFLQLLIIPLKSFKFFTALQYLSAIIVQLTLYCWNGHHVIVQSATISDSCYAMEWYRCSSKIKKEIRLIMEGCKKPIKLRAGGIFVLSVTTLTKILRTSYQYFTVLRQVYLK